MNILYLSQVLMYPPDAGPKVRSYYTIRHLARNHSVYLIAFTRSDDTPEAIEHLQQYCKAINTVSMQRTRVKDMYFLLASILTGKSFIIRRDYVGEMVRKVDEVLAGSDIDVIHADQLWMAQYAIHAKRKYPNLKLIIDEHNACYQIYERLAKGEANPIKRLLLEREWRFLRRTEAELISKFDVVVTVIGNDKDNLEGMVAENVIKSKHIPDFFTIPICVDPEIVKPVPVPDQSLSVVYMGTMLWPPNIEGVLWFAREVWPLVLAQLPGATFTIIGKNPPPPVIALGSLELAGKPANIRVTGYVPDVRPYLEETGVMVVPLLSGGGMRVKIVDGWRWGLPIVSTTIGAEGIDYAHGENILIADEPEQIAKAVVRVLTDHKLARSLRENGRDWVERNYDWAKIYTAWDQVYERLNERTLS